MKKLNKGELEALASRIEEDMKAANQKFIDINIDENKQINQAKRDNLLYLLNNQNHVLQEYLETLIGYNKKDYMEAQEVLSYVEKQMLKGLKLPYSSNSGYHYKESIINKLILAQIEAPDLQSMVASVTKQFMED